MFICNIYFNIYICIRYLLITGTNVLHEQEQANSCVHLKKKVHCIFIAVTNYIFMENNCRYKIT